MPDQPRQRAVWACPLTPATSRIICSELDSLRAAWCCSGCNCTSLREGSWVWFPVGPGLVLHVLLCLRGVPWYSSSLSQSVHVCLAGVFLIVWLLGFKCQPCNGLLPNDSWDRLRRSSAVGRAVIDSGWMDPRHQTGLSSSQQLHSVSCAAGSVNSIQLPSFHACFRNKWSHLFIRKPTNISRQSSWRTSEAKPGNSFSIKYDPVSPEAENAVVLLHRTSGAGPRNTHEVGSMSRYYCLKFGVPEEIMI